MAWMYSFRDTFFSVDKRLDEFGITKGTTVIDYGCGTGSYLKRASHLVGEEGKIYAVDIHPLAIEAIKKKIKKFNLGNVEPVLVDGYISGLTYGTADVIFALDMFHNIYNPEEFLKELRRIVKQDGILIIEDGHQPREQTKEKIVSSKLWNIIEETKDHLRCTPGYPE